MEREGKEKMEDIEKREGDGGGRRELGGYKPFFMTPFTHHSHCYVTVNNTLPGPIPNEGVSL